MMEIPDNITHITNDSREVRPGSLFLAYPGGVCDGRQYLVEAITKGAAVLMLEARDAEKFLPAGYAVPMIKVENLARQQSAIAAAFYGHPSQHMQVVGVTGTNGKTSVTQFIAQALQALRQPCGVIGTLGNGLYPHLHKGTHTTPDPIQCQRLLSELRQQGAKSVAMEVSSHSLDQRREAAVCFAVAVFTNLTRDHLDYHGSMEAYGQAKQRLFEHEECQTVVINIDDAFGRQLIKQPFIKNKRQCLSYSLQDARATLFVQSVIATDEGFQLQCRVDGQPFAFSLPLVGRFNISNSLATLGALLALGVESADLPQAMQALQPVNGRMQVWRGAGGVTVVVDYAHTPDALSQALGALREHCSGNLWCVFGCGGDRDRGKRAEMAKVAQALADRIVLTNDNPRSESPDQIIADILEGFIEPQTIQIERDRERAIQQAIQQAAASDIILIAGKGHEDYQIIGDNTFAFSDSKVVQQQLQWLK